MTDLARDLAAERRMTRSVVSARLAGAASALSAFAAHRAGAGPVLGIDERDMPVEVLEELADARNYSLWWIRDLGDHPAVADVRACLAAVITAYHHALAAQRATTPGFQTRPHRPGLQIAILETALTFPDCSCELDAAMSNQALVALGAGCTGPRWTCSRLAAVRRRVL